MSTGFEAILVLCILEGKRERIEEIWDKVRRLK
jgi:23S rRNA maturation mini-RNase III